MPWHLTTREFVAEVDRVLRPDGVYVMNVIDGGRLRFLKSEINTLRDQFEYAAAISAESSFLGGFVDNVVLVGSHRKLDHAALADLVGRHFQVVLDGEKLARFAGKARVLTDDYAPVDQWLTQELR